MILLLMIWITLLTSYVYHVIWLLQHLVFNITSGHQVRKHGHHEWDISLVDSFISRVWSTQVGFLCTRIFHLGDWSIIERYENLKKHLSKLKTLMVGRNLKVSGCNYSRIHVTRQIHFLMRFLVFYQCYFASVWFSNWWLISAISPIALLNSIQKPFSVGYFLFLWQLKILSKDENPWFFPLFSGIILTLI